MGIINILQQYGAQRKSWWYINVSVNPERVIFVDLDIYYLLKKQEILQLLALCLRL